MTDEDLLAHIDQRLREYKGDVTQLERAVGAAILGRRLGWKVLLLVHDRKTVEKYERLLKLNFKVVMAPEGDTAHKSVAWVAVQKVSSFWKAVKGEYPDVKSVNAK